MLGYQLEPALALIRGATSRVLLADEVGLGKTVQAGLILGELRARGEARRTLILCPAGLREQWRQELHERFGLEVRVMDATTLARAVLDLPPSVNPWSLPQMSIASIDFVKRSEVMAALDALVWDLLIVDEAHALSTSTDRERAGRRLAIRSRRVVLISATPHSGDEAAFRALCDIGNLRDGPMMLFRRSHREAGRLGRRRSHLLRVRPTAAEQDMHALLAGYIAAVRADRGDGPGTALTLEVLKKRSLSSAGSLARSISRRIAWLQGEPEVEEQLALPFLEDDDCSADAEPLRHLVGPGLRDSGREREWLATLRSTALLASRGESKRHRLMALLHRVADRVIVFTEYRDTLCALAEAVASFPFAVLHGGMDVAARQLAARSFTDGPARILLATDAAGEGLNLHARCRLVVNYELPWNPVRLEQRIGRVDRIGQTRTAHAIHLVAAGTSEERVLWRLLARVDRMRASVGQSHDIVGRLDRRRLAGAVLHDEPGRLDELWGNPDPAPTATMRPRTLAPPDASPDIDPPPQEWSEPRSLQPVGPGLSEAARQEARRILQERHLRCSADRSACRRPGAFVPTTPARARRFDRSMPGAGAALSCLYRAIVHDGAGEPLESILILLSLPRAHVPSDRHATAPQRIDDAIATARPALHAVVRASVAPRVEAVRKAFAASLARSADRERAILTALGVALAPQPVQTGLFDRRSLRAAEAHAEGVAILQRESASRLARLTEAGPVRIGDLQLVLVAAARVGR